MPIRIFESTNTIELEKKVNEFVEDKKVLNTHFATTLDPAVSKAVRYQVLVEYED